MISEELCTLRKNNHPDDYASHVQLQHILKKYDILTAFRKDNFKNDFNIFTFTLLQHLHKNCQDKHTQHVKLNTPK